MIDLPASRSLPPDQQLVVDIELTNICNFRCPICPHGNKDLPENKLGEPFVRRGAFMSDAVFARAVDECNRVARVVELGFFGEQTLHRNYHERLRALKNRRFRLETSTNLSRLTWSTFDTWVEAQMDLVRLSIDAIRPAVFNRARPGNVHDLNGKAVSEEERLAAINEKAHRWLERRDHRPTRIVFVQSSHNEGEAADFVAYWRPFLGANDVILVKQVLTYGGIVPIAHQALNRCNVWDVRYVMIDVHGNCTPCNLDVNVQLHLGNIMQDSIENLYHGPIAQWLKTQTGCGKALSPCKTCVDGNNWSENETIPALPRETVPAER